MCELHVTVKLYIAEGGLRDAASYFFPNQRNSCSCILFKICTTLQLYIGTNVKLSEKNEAGNIRKIGVNLISNIV